MPGSPPTSSAEPRTKPPPVARSSSAMPVAMRGASSMSPDSVVSATGRPLRGDAQRRRPAADAAAGAFLDQRVPLAAGVALAGPARVHGAAGLADELDAGLSHQGCPPRALSGDGAPLCLPDISPTGGRSAAATLRHSATEDWRSRRPPISPLWGRCPAGRGGRVECRLSHNHAATHTGPADGCPRRGRRSA